LKGLSGKMGGDSSTVSSSLSSSSGTGLSDNLASEGGYTLAEKAEEKETITLNIQGDVLDSEESGMRIVDMLNNAFDMNGAAVRTA